MNANEQVIFKHKPCVVLDAELEGYSLEKDQVLLQEESSHFIGAGPMRHLAHFEDIARQPDDLQFNFQRR